MKFILFCLTMMAMSMAAFANNNGGDGNGGATKKDGPESVSSGQKSSPDQAVKELRSGNEGN